MEKVRVTSLLISTTTGSAAGGRMSMGAYCDLAEEIGYTPDPDMLLHEKLRAFLAARSILAYDPASVCQYLAEKVAALGSSNWTWVWKPLRKEDTGVGCANDGVRAGTAPIWGGAVSKKLYKHVIPASVLYTVRRIARGFPKAHFYVSDFEEFGETSHLFRPDPFVAVAVPRTPFIIVEFWDEKGYQPIADARQAAIISTQP